MSRHRAGRLPALLPAALLLAACGGSGAVAPVEAHDPAGIAQWLRDQRGKPLLVNFWATWCGPCLAELPDLLAATREFRAAGGVVVGIAMERMDQGQDHAVAKAAAKAAELGVDFPTLVCTDDDLIAVRQALGLALGALPQTFAYGRDGALVEQHEGIASAAEFAALAAKAAAAR